MTGFAGRLFVMSLLVLGLLVPKVSALALHLHPNVRAIVICTGAEMVTIHVGPDGEPIDTSETDHAPCVLADPNAAAQPPYEKWTRAPKTYRASFVEVVHDLRNEAELGLFPDFRGPPLMI